VTVALVSSVLLGLIAVDASRAGLTRLIANGASRDPHAYRALGLVTPFPAPPIAFLGLLGTPPVTRASSIVISSLFLALAGVLATRAGMNRLAPGSGRDSHVYWALGLAALLPAWLVAFVTLLPDVPGTRPQLIAAVAWILSAASGLLGAIATEGRLRRLAESGSPLSPGRLWGLGLVALAPSWLIALVGHVLR
jgi:hypothetical protein